MLSLLAGAGRLLGSGAGKKVADSASKKAAGTAGKKLSKDKFFNKEEKQESGNIKTGMARPSISPTKLLPPSDIKDPPKKVDLSKGGEEGRIKDTFNKIDDTLNGIISSINRENQFRKKESEDSRKRAELENKQRQENKLERGGSRGIGPSIKLPGDGFGIGKFFKNILIGGLILAIMKNLQSIIEFFKKTYKQVKEFMEKLGEFLTPIWNGLKWIVGEGIKLVAKMLGIPAEDVDDKDILKNLNEISKKIPGLKQLFEGINKTIASLKSGNTPSGESAPPSTGGTQSGDLFEIIAGGEGGYESINRGNAGDSPGGAAAYFGKNLTDMTVGEVMSLQSQGKVFAVGKYQIIPKTMIGFVRNMNISMNDKFDATTQEKFKDYVVNIKRPEVGKYIRGESTNRAEAAQELAREFASVGLSYSEAGKVRGQSRYAGSAGNRASISPEAIEAALDRARSGESVSSESAQIMTEGTYTVSGVTYSVKTGEPIETPPPATQAPTQAPTPAQVQAPAQSPAASSASAISESADYEMPGGVSGTMIMPMQSQGGSPTISGGGGGGGIMPVGISKKEVLNSLYQAQLVGFLYKQG